MNIVYQGFLEWIATECVETFHAEIWLCGRDHESEQRDKTIGQFGNMDTAAKVTPNRISVRRRFDEANGVIFEADDITLKLDGKLEKKPRYIVLSVGTVAMARFVIPPPAQSSTMIDLRWRGSVAGKGGWLVQVSANDAE